jgi:hypothetical protein
MSKLKRMKRKRAKQKKANIRRMALQKDLRATLGPNKLLKRMTRDHVDILQNIEFTLISDYREEPEDSRSQKLNDSLEAMREFRSDVPDDLWRDGLRTVLQSVHRHSNLRPGERNYINFVSDFIP